jgi:ABC-2 type transport system ATP-binding protein
VDAIVSVEGLVKRFGDVTAVDGVSFDVAPGEVFGLLGPNGAGKTTTISMLSCLLAPDEGEARVAGSSIRSDTLAVRAALGVVPQEIALYPTLTAAENLRFWARMYGLSGHALSEAVDYGLAMAGLEDKAKKRVETFSGGMKRRINIAAGVLHRPQVLLMDEPTVGIDPQSRNHILDTVRSLNQEGMTVIYTSHYMQEVEELCDRIAIIDHGRVIALGTLDELSALVGDEDRVRVTLDGSPAAATGDLAQALSEVPGVSGAHVEDGVAEVRAPSAGAVLGAVVEALANAGVGIRAVEVVEPNLESVFLHLTGRELRD